MKLMKTLCALTLLATTGMNAVVQTQDPHSYCAILYGFKPGSDAYNECVQKVKENNALAQNNKKGNPAQKNTSGKSNKKSCCR